MDLTDADVAEILASFGEVAIDWSDEETWERILLAAHRRGLLEGVKIHRLSTKRNRPREYLLSVCVSDDVTLCSAPVGWLQEDPGETTIGAPSMRQVLMCIADIAQELREKFIADTWMRVAEELAAIRKLIGEVPTSEAEEDAGR